MLNNIFTIEVVVSGVIKYRCKTCGYKDIILTRMGLFSTYATYVLYFIEYNRIYIGLFLFFKEYKI